MNFNSTTMSIIYHKFLKKSIDIVYINLIILYIKLMILKDVEIYGFLLEKKLNQGIL